MADSMVMDTSFDDSSSDLSSARSISPPSGAPLLGSSSPLSALSSTPSPPLYRKRSQDYPTPVSSQESSQRGSPTPDGMESKDGQRAAKRRRITKERSTKPLDLRGTAIVQEEKEQYDRLMRALHNSRKIVVVAGAGISASAGIPVFRSSTGIFSSLKAEHKLKGSGKDLFDASVYNDPESTTAFHSMVRDMSRLMKTAQPTPFHHLIATLAQEGRLLRLYTQNVDCIETSLEPLRTTVPLRKNEDGTWPKTIQLHGGLEKMVCSKCHHLSDLDPGLFEGPAAPLCAECIERNDVRLNVGKRSHGIGRLRPRMVLYSERNPDEEAIGRIAGQDIRRRPDTVIVVGTTLKVPGVCRIVKEMCATTRDLKGGVTVWINNDPPPGGQFEDSFDIVVAGTADKVAQHAALRQWNQTPEPISNGNSSPIPATLNTIELASSDHINNSFRPPSPHLIRPTVEPIAPPFSPLKVPPGVQVLKSIEKEEGGKDTFVREAEPGLPTPSKSERSTPLFNILQSKSFKPVAKRGTGAIRPVGKTTKANKSKASATAKKSKAEPKWQTLSSTFKTSKTEVPARPNAEKVLLTTPTKMHLAHILNPSSERRRTPSKKSPVKPVSFPNLPQARENAEPSF